MSGARNAEIRQALEHKKQELETRLERSTESASQGLDSLIKRG